MISRSTRPTNIKPRDPHIVFQNRLINQVNDKRINQNNYRIYKRVLQKSSYYRFVAPEEIQYELVRHSCVRIQVCHCLTHAISLYVLNNAIGTSLCLDIQMENSSDIKKPKYGDGKDRISVSLHRLEWVRMYHLCPRSHKYHVSIYCICPVKLEWSESIRW